MAQATPESLTAAYSAAVDDVKDRIVRFASTVWGATPSLRDPDVQRLVNLIAPRVQAGQLRVADLTNGYVQRLAVLEGVVAEAAVVDVGAIVGYRGVPAAEVYRRPAVQAYTAMAGGESYPKAFEQSTRRLASIVSTDIQQSANRQARAAYSSSGFEYTLRVLTGRENCALCVIASTQRYLIRRELMPIHPGCDCKQRGVKAASDPGQVIDRELLERVHDAVEAKFGQSDRGARFIREAPEPNDISDYLDLIVVNDHGELGPTLAWRGDHFTGPDDIH